MATSEQLIREAIATGRAVIRLADGNVHVCDLSQHMFPDVVCNAPGCARAYDSRLARVPHLERWLNGTSAANIIKRDNWRFGLCPDHC
ncbi:MAG: hypothetical protein HYT31_01045 [Parcubacteria group bacterium]|nr:hypothetical protein [Parcubacteria group bacterium]